MTTYIAQFTAKHRIVQIQQHSVFIWRQDGGVMEVSLLIDKIKRESVMHFYKLIVGAGYKVLSDDISVTVQKTMPFSG